MLWHYVHTAAFRKKSVIFCEGPKALETAEDLSVVSITSNALFKQIRRKKHRYNTLKTEEIFAKFISILFLSEESA